MKYIRKIKNGNWSLVPKMELPEFFVEAKMDLLKKNINIPGSKILDIIEKPPKITKRIFHFLPKFCKII